jgi:hypothetical protein
MQKQEAMELETSLSKQLPRVQRVWKQKQFLKDKDVHLAV